MTVRALGGRDFEGDAAGRPTGRERVGDDFAGDMGF